VSAAKASKKLQPPSELQEAHQEQEYWIRKLAAMAYAKRLLDADIQVAEKQVQRWTQKVDALRGKK